MLPGGMEVAFSNVDLAERRVGGGELRLEFEGVEQLTFCFLRGAVLHAQELREFIVTFSPAGALLQRFPMFRDLPRSVGIQNMVENIASKGHGLSVSEAA